MKERLTIKNFKPCHKRTLQALGTPTLILLLRHNSCRFKIQKSWFINNNAWTWIIYLYDVLTKTEKIVMGKHGNIYSCPPPNVSGWLFNIPVYMGNVQITNCNAITDSYALWIMLCAWRKYNIIGMLFIFHKVYFRYVNCWQMLLTQTF